jgi:hypothetical protein
MIKGPIRIEMRMHLEKSDSAFVQARYREVPDTFGLRLWGSRACWTNSEGTTMRPFLYWWPKYVGSAYEKDV